MGCKREVHSSAPHGSRIHRSQRHGLDQIPAPTSRPQYLARESRRDTKTVFSSTYSFWATFDLATRSSTHAHMQGHSSKLLFPASNQPFSVGGGTSVRSLQYTFHLCIQILLYHFASLPNASNHLQHFTHKPPARLIIACQSCQHAT